jgi:two-component system OmpR family response regulator
MTAVPRKLLVVDDDTHIRRLIRIYLRDAGFDVADAATGEEALEQAAKERFDVVIVDVILPYFGGFRLCQKLKAAEAPPRVVIISGDDSPETQQTARDYRADAFVAKPFTKEEIVSAAGA